jgi:hypothetical protein
VALLAEPSVVTDLLPQYNIPAAQLDAAQRMVAGWLQSDAGLADPPADLTDGDDLFSAAFELVTLLVTNPELLASKTAGPTSRTWPVAQRRDAIRREVREAAQRAAGGAAAGCFPPAQCWPDPVWPDRRRDWA